MKKFVLTAFAALMAVAFVACEEKKSNDDEQAAEAIEEVVEEAEAQISEINEELKAKLQELGEGFFGTYEANLPGNPGTVATLVLNADGTFTLTEVDVNGEPAGDEAGTVTDINSDLVLTLVANDGMTRYLKYTEGKLLLLTPEGNEPDAELREHYFFTRK